MKRSAFSKDISRTISKESRRFCAIIIITILGVAMFSGLIAACQDLRRSADAFYDAQHLHDIYIASTLGLTDEDVQALLEIDGVEKAEGIYAESVLAVLDDVTISISMQTLSEEGMDEPYIVSGRLPESADEVAVTEEFLTDSELSIGDTLVISEELTVDEDTGETEEATFAITEYTICGVVIDPTSIDNPNGNTSFRTSNTSEPTVYILPGAADADIYTSIVLTLEDTAEMYCYDSEYDEAVSAFKDYLEDEIKSVREEARYNELVSEAEEELAEAEAEVESELAEAEDALVEYEEALAEYEDIVEQYRETLAEYEAMSAAYGIDITAEATELAAAIAQYEAAIDEIEEALAEGWAEYDDAKAEAEAELEEAREAIDDIETATWYIQTRDSLSGYSNVSSDASSIETLGTIFPVIFFTVAILISLTTITRMVDDDRSDIGTYMALGFTISETKRKYLFYSLTACAIGSAIGTFCAFFILPLILFSIFETMYLIPEYIFTFVPVFGILGPLIFTGGILVVTDYACRRKMRHKPATLMRPKAPKSGTRVALENVTALWSKLSFLGKVTARNVFRYKKRLFMTILGIAGCTALLLMGFSLKDAVSELMPRQYERIYSYDIMAVASSSEDQDALISYIDDDSQVEGYISAEITSGTLSFGDDDSTSVTLIVVPDGSDFASYINLYDLDGNSLTLEAESIYVTRNAGDVLDFEEEDIVSLQLADLSQADLPVSAIVENYLGNYVYMTSSTFEAYFGEDEYEKNGVLITLSDECEDHQEYADTLASLDGIVSCMCNEELMESFSTSFKLINMIVYVVIVMSAALALVVLFTLQTTNISEREREIATIKVLGFYDIEVHTYINSETYILTLIGIIVGLPLGYALAQVLSVMLNLPSIYLPPTLYPISYLYAVLLDAAFAIVVNLITNISLDKLNPAVALKSVE